MDSAHLPLIERTRKALAKAGLRQALLSSPESLGQLAGYIMPCEDWPVADPFTAAPPLLLITAQDAVLIVPTLFIAYADTSEWSVIETPCYRWRGAPPDPYAELCNTLAGLQWDDGPLGAQGRSLPARAAEIIRAQGHELRWVDDLLATANRQKLPSEIDAVRNASTMADAIQTAVREMAEPGQTEAQLAALATARATTLLRRRFPVMLTLDAGPGSAAGSSIPSSRVLSAGDLVLTDASPWVDGAWSDTCSTVVVGQPTREQQRVFDEVRRALELAVSLCRPGALAGDIDRRVRDSLSSFGSHVYSHHTGHGLGSTWNESPRIIAGSKDVIEEGMVIAVEPGVYVPGWGGLRLEDVFVVGPESNEMLSQLEHAL